MAATEIFPLEVWTTQITQASVPANNNSLRVQVLNAAAISISNDPSGPHTENDVYIVGSTPNGSFAGFTKDNVVIYKGGTFLEFKVFKGWIKTVGNDAYLYNGTNWVVFAVGPTAEPWTYLYLTSDFTNNTTTYNDITDITFAASATSKYEIELFGAYQTSATTTGLGIKASGPTGSSFIGQIQVFTSANTIAGANQFSDTTPTTVTTGVTTANTNTPINGRFLVSTSTTTGNITLQMRSEVASSNVTLKSDLFYVRYRKLP